MSELLRLVNEAKENGVVPKLHPHGFIQLDLKGDRSSRLHVWDNDIPRSADHFTVHDHVWDFDSEVLCGSLRNVHYLFMTSSNGKWIEWEASEKRHEGTRGGKVLVPTDKKFALQTIKSQNVYPGQKYNFKAFQFHDTEAFGLTVTLFSKTKVHDNANPRILCKIGHSPDGEVPESVTVEWMWEKLFIAALTAEEKRGFE